MLFLDDIKNITKENELYKYIVKTGQNLEKTIEVQYAKKRALTQILDEIANLEVIEVNLDNTKNLLEMIEEIKNVLDRINDNIDGARRMKEEINNIIVRIDSLMSNKTDDESLSKDINYFYMLYIEKVNIIEDTNLVYEGAILKACEYIFSVNSINNKKEYHINNKNESILIEENEENEENIFFKNELELPKLKESADNQIFKEFKIGITKLDEKSETNINMPEEKSKTNIIKPEEKNEINTKKPDEKLEIKKSSKNEKVNKLRENNTLKISETQDKVFLPYKGYELEDKLKKSPDKYSSIEDVINTEYIIPLGKYKNAAFSRFKEAYNLMRVKEKSSFSEALDLALELTFKNELNPAVITACKDLHELDSYLDCLEKNNLDKFRFFNIEYEVLPSIKK